jgi:rfaE bifunctional protein kinase chain/domain
MSPDRFQTITGSYPKLRVAIVGDFCLDRYLEIDPAKQELSLETGLAVHNVVRVRSQPGGAGTILNNLEALGVGQIFPVGFAGRDGEGFELMQALQARRGVSLEHFLQTPERRTFTYCKPLVLQPGRGPVELNRLDSKNWTPTPPAVQAWLAEAVTALADQVDGVILLDQVDHAGTGVITSGLLETIGQVSRQRPGRWIMADSRRGLRGFPPVCFKMNGAELAALVGEKGGVGSASARDLAGTLAKQNGRPVFVTLAEQGILGASAEGQVDHLPALPTRGEIDIVGAGDAVTANLTAALAGGASSREAIELANAAASIVIHQLGTTGTASVPQIRPFAVTA